MSWGQTVYLANLIKGKKTFVASDNLYSVLSTKTLSAGVTAEEYISFVLKTGGSFKLKGYGYSNYSTGYMSIYKNGTLLSSIPTSENNTDVEIVSDIITCNAKDEITIKIYNSKSAGSMRLNRVDFLATVNDGSLISIL